MYFWSLMLFNKIFMTYQKNKENKLKESETQLEKFSNNSLENMLHTQNSNCDKSKLRFDCHVALSSKNDSSSEIIFVKPKKVEDYLVKRKTAAAPTSQGKKVKKIYIEPCVSYPKCRVVHPPRNLPP